MPDHYGQAAAQPAPGSLRWVEELINTRSVESGTDEIAAPALLASWLWHRELLPAGVRVSIDEHHRALRVREGLRALVAANNTVPGAADHARGSRPVRGLGESA